MYGGGGTFILPLLTEYEKAPHIFIVGLSFQFWILVLLYKGP